MGEGGGGGRKRDEPLFWVKNSIVFGVTGGEGGSNFPHFQRDVINGWPLIWLSYRQGITILGFMKILYQNPPGWYSFKLFSYKNVYWFWFGHHLEMDLTYSNRMRCSISSKCILTKYVSDRAKWIADRRNTNTNVDDHENYVLR